MADEGISISVEGLAGLQAKLDDLSTKQADACIRKALAAGAAIEQAAISERAPTKDGTGGSLPDGALKNDAKAFKSLVEQNKLNALAGLLTGKADTSSIAGSTNYGMDEISRLGQPRSSACGSTVAV